MTTASEDLWDAIAELVLACGGSAAEFPEDVTAKITTAVERIQGEAWDDAMRAADSD